MNRRGFIAGLLASAAAIKVVPAIPAVEHVAVNTALPLEYLEALDRLANPPLIVSPNMYVYARAFAPDLVRAYNARPWELIPEPVEDDLYIEAGGCTYVVGVDLAPAESFSMAMLIDARDKLNAAPFPWDNWRRRLAEMSPAERQSYLYGEWADET